jgi:hypothetical protein
MSNKNRENTNPLPPKERLHELFTYSFVEGALYWKIYSKPKLAGCDDWHTGYWRVKINKVMYQRHRLIWAHFYGDPGPYIVDHINKTRNDDRIENLRLANEAQNRHNSKMHCTNTSGFKGVYYHASRNKWRARMYLKRRSVSLGYYSTKEEAAAAYAEASSRLHGEFAGHLQ